MKRILFLLLLPFGVCAQFVPDSTEYIVFKAYQDSLMQELKVENNQNFLHDFNNRFEKYYNKGFQYKQFESLSIDALEMDLYDQRAAQRKLLKEAKISSFLRKHIENENEFQYWHLMYAYPIIKSNAETKSRRVAAIPEVVLKGFNHDILSNENNLKYQAFRNLVPQYINYENSKNQRFEKYTNLLQAVNDKSDFALKNFKGLMIDYSLSHVLQTHKPYLSTSLASNIISQINSDELRNLFVGKFIEDVQAQTLKNELAKKEAKSNTSLEFVDLKGKNFDLSKYKGKVIYLDFWASWCGPCKVQFPHAKRLKDEIPAKFKKDIVFLYISIDETKDQWKEGLKDNQLENFENGYTEGAWGSAVLQKLGVRSIPRYMLFDRSGKLVDANAKRPSSPDILNELIKLAEEK